MQKLIIGNLKMNITTLAERENFFESFKKELKNAKLKNTQIVLCVPAVHLEAFVKQLKNKVVAIGTQNIFWEEKGSYTGEISAPMVKSLGGEYVIIGHSERRKYFFESNEIANAKIKMSIKNGLKPIYCVGETKEQHLAGITSEVVIDQIEKGLAEIPASKMHSVVIAYEPVWAIGSGLVPTCNEILEVKILLKKIFTNKYGADIAKKISILYGGSVNVSSSAQVCSQPEMDGALVGGESLKPSEFLKIAEIIDKN